MIPGGFKKDSRVWLHKNGTKYLKKSSLLAGCECEGQRIFSDDPYECVPHEQRNVREPIITDASGRIYKKDSRTWLHKSSVKKLKTTRGGDLIEEVGARMDWRHGSRILNTTNDSDVTMLTRSSTEVIRAQNGVSKLKKKKTAMFMSVAMNQPCGGGGMATLPENRQHTGLNKFRSSVKRASFHDLNTSGKGCTTVAAFASDLCIADKLRSRSRIDLQDGLADSDNEHSNELDEDDDQQEGFEDDVQAEWLGLDSERGGQQQQQQQQQQRGGVRRQTWNHSTVEITKDGLRELEKMMKDQTHRRSARLAKLVDDHPGQTTGCDVSPQSLSSDSRASLDATVNLSEELLYGGERKQSQNSAEQLSQATEYLHVCSPHRQNNNANRR